MDYIQTFVWLHRYISRRSHDFNYCFQRAGKGCHHGTESEHGVLEKKATKKCPVPGSNWRPPDINYSRHARSYYETDVITIYTNETRLQDG